MIATILAYFSLHEKGDLVYWAFFFLGQCLYVLKRAASAIRSKTNPIKSRSAFVGANWDILLIRFVLEIIVPFYPARHFNVATLAGWINFTLPSWISPQAHLGILGFLALGFAADAILDWVSQSEKLPVWIRNFIKEQVPQVPQQLVAVVETKTTISSVDDSQPVKETTTVTPVTAPIQEKKDI
jgi:hypothetical protein